jgi:hypothetical protein
MNGVISFKKKGALGLIMGCIVILSLVSCGHGGSGDSPCCCILCLVFLVGLVKGCCECCCNCCEH